MYALSRIYPTLRKSYGTDLKEYYNSLEEIDALDSSKYTEESWSTLQKTIGDSRIVVSQEDLLQAEIDIQVQSITSKYEILEKKPVSKTIIKEDIEEAKLLETKEYTTESWKKTNLSITTSN